MAASIYFLCTTTAMLCSILLWRGFLQSRFRLLFWSSICFAFMTADNLFLLLDRVVLPEIDLVLWRRPFALLGLLFLLYGMIWEGQE